MSNQIWGETNGIENDREQELKIPKKKLEGRPELNSEIRLTERQQLALLISGCVTNNYDHDCEKKDEGSFCEN